MKILQAIIQFWNEKLVAEKVDSLETQNKGNACHQKPLPSSMVKTVTENTNLFVTVICKV
jgi:hypothetical protein